MEAHAGAEAGQEPGWEGLERWVFHESAMLLKGERRLVYVGW